MLLAVVVAATGCASAAPMKRDTVDRAYAEIRDRGLAAFAEAATQPGSGAEGRPQVSVQRLMVELRAILEDLPHDETEILFDAAPQGLRWASGVPRDRRRYLRDGVLTSHTFVQDALLDDYSFEGLERYVRGLERISTIESKDESVDSAPFAGRLGNIPAQAVVNPLVADI